MQTTMSVNEAKANFSGMLSEVKSGLVSFTIMRYGHPIARIVPIEQTRKIRPMSGYGQKIAVKGDVFAIVTGDGKFSQYGVNVFC